MPKRAGPPNNHRRADETRRSLDAIRLTAAQIQAAPTANTELLVTTAKMLAAPVRLLLLEQRPLFTGRFLHPLRRASSLTGEIFTRGQLHLTVRGPDRSATRGDYGVEVHPLHGLAYSNESWHLAGMFDTGRQSMTVSRWLKQRVLRVDSTEYTLESVLRFAVNRDSLHLSHEVDEQRRHLELVNVGTLHYPAMVLHHTAAYLVNISLFCQIPRSDTDCSPFGIHSELVGTGITLSSQDDVPPLVTSPARINRISVVRAL